MIVGNVEGYCVPPLNLEVQATLDKDQRQFFAQNAGKEFPLDSVEKAKKEIENFCAVLEQEGVKVRRSDNFSQNEGDYTTPDFHSLGGCHRAMPRCDLNS